MVRESTASCRRRCGGSTSSAPQQIWAEWKQRKVVHAIASARVPDGRQCAHWPWVSIALLRRATLRLRLPHLAAPELSRILLSPTTICSPLLQVLLFLMDATPLTFSLQSSLHTSSYHIQRAVFDYTFFLCRVHSLPHSLCAR